MIVWLKSFGIAIVFIAILAALVFGLSKLPAYVFIVIWIITAITGVASLVRICLLYK